MSKINPLHDQAMVAEKAFLAQQKGDKITFLRLSKEAFLLEKAAAMLLKDKMDIEPSRSILFKSAAFLAYDAQEYQACRDMITYTLLGKPDTIIQAEMKALFWEVDALFQKVPSKWEEIKNKIAFLEGGKEIIREIELRLPAMVGYNCGASHCCTIHYPQNKIRLCPFVGIFCTDLYRVLSFRRNLLRRRFPTEGQNAVQIGTKDSYGRTKCGTNRYKRFLRKDKAEFYSVGSR